MAIIGSTTIEQDDFDRLLAEYLERGDVFGTLPAIDGEVPSGEARRLLGALVQVAATNEVLNRAGQLMVDSDDDPDYGLVVDYGVRTGSFGGAH